jgi:hypothetical protein
MFTTIEGFYKDGTVELNEKPVRQEPARVLVTFLPEPRTKGRPKALYGAWQGKMPEELDIDAALNEIRGEWATEWESSVGE